MTRACRKCGSLVCRCGTLGPCCICRDPIKERDVLGSYAGEFCHHSCAVTALALDLATPERRSKEVVHDAR